MKNKRFVALAIALLIGGGLGAAAADQGLERTSASWTDQGQVAAAVTAGTWTTTTASTCVAYGDNREQLAGCRVVDTSYYFGWVDSGKHFRNYYLNFDVPSGTRWVSFDVDLSTLQGNESTWSWTSSKVLSGAQFTSRDGWNCSQLPRARGTGLEWQTHSIYFKVVENDPSASAMCS
ncbi:hypothetical protein [Microbacterium profundi]|uniref:hypothetical protein n=1 Tax=Microbacterium profundi TaxID=450380 RepID=UPI00051A239E|nr:hypothetical protein [Microbacterium profundi]